MTTPICFIDIESDGLRPRRQPWEIAVIRRDTDVTGIVNETTWQAFIQIDLDEAEPKGLQVGGFYDRHPLGRWLSGKIEKWPAFRSVDAPADGVTDYLVGVGDYLDTLTAARIVARLTHSALIVGATPSFDTEVLARLLRESWLIEAWQYRIKCVSTLTEGHMGRVVGGLADCAAALGIDHPDAHTALGDARTVRAIWDHIMTNAEKTLRLGVTR